MPKEKIKEEKLRTRKNFWFCILATLHTIFAEDGFSWHPLSLTNYMPSRKQVSRNQTTRAQQEAQREGSNLAQKTATLRPPL
jgi:hypothetical protein